MGTAGESSGKKAFGFLERRAFPRFPVRLVGTCSIAGGVDSPCVACDMSVGGLRLTCAADAIIGAAVTLSFPQIGLVRGTVARAFDGGFAVAFVAGRPQRERVTNYLVWLLALRDDPALEDRVHVRLVPLRRVVPLTSSGSTYTARIVDVSRSGVAVTTTVEVGIGEEVIVGRTRAFVVRLYDGGFAARFFDLLDDDFDVSITL